MMRTSLIMIMSSVLLIGYFSDDVSAASACLAGPQATGFAWGPITLGASLKSGEADSFTSAETCGPGTAPAVDLVSNNGVGVVETSGGANGLYTHAESITSANPPFVGTGRATAASSLGILFRLATTPAYTGTGTEEVNYAVRIAGTGEGLANGPGASTGGTYSVDVDIVLLDGAGTKLLALGGAALQTYDTLRTGSLSVAVDTDYVFTISHLQQLQTSGGYDGTTFGSGSSSSMITTTFGLGLPASAEGVTLEFPMVDALGLTPPILTTATPNTAAFLPVMLDILE